MKREYRKRTHPFTVVLLYPDYATGDFGADVYVTSVQAANSVVAAKRAQDEAADNVTHNGKKIPAQDFRMILVFEGDCNVVADAINN